MNTKLYKLEEMLMTEIDYHTTLLRIPSKTEADDAHDLSSQTHILFIESVIKEIHKIGEKL